MFRNLFRNSICALLLTLLLAGSAPAAAADWSSLDRWDSGLWRWVVSLWSADEDGDGDRGLELDPDGLTSGGERGPGADPNGQTGDGDRGPELDPNG